jgi:hypothetical protein
MRHANGAVGTTPEKVKVKRGIGQFVRVRNADTIDDLFISFNNGRDYSTLVPGAILEVNALFHFLVLLGEAAGVDYELLIGEG